MTTSIGFTVDCNEVGTPAAVTNDDDDLDDAGSTFMSEEI